MQTLIIPCPTSAHCEGQTFNKPMSRDFVAQGLSGPLGAQGAEGKQGPMVGGTSSLITRSL